MKKMIILTTILTIFAACTAIVNNEETVTTSTGTISNKTIGWGIKRKIYI